MEKIGNMLKRLLPNFRPDLSGRLKDITEKQVPAKLKPIVVLSMPIHSMPRLDSMPEKNCPKWRFAICDLVPQPLIG